MVKMSYDVVKRWVNEAQEAASSDNIMVQVRGVNNEISFNLALLYGSDDEEDSPKIIIGPE